MGLGWLLNVLESILKAQGKRKSTSKKTRPKKSLQIVHNQLKTWQQCVVFVIRWLPESAAFNAEIETETVQKNEIESFFFLEMAKSSIGGAPAGYVIRTRVESCLSFFFFPILVTSWTGRNVFFSSTPSRIRGLEKWRYCDIDDFTRLDGVMCLLTLTELLLDLSR